MRTLKVIIASLAIGSLLAFAACKKDDKKDDSKEEKTDKTDGDTATAGKATDDKAATGDDKAATGDGASMSMDDKKKMAGEVMTMFENVAKAVEENAEDCAKMAEAVQKVADDNKELIAKGQKMRKEDDPEFQKWFEETHGEKMKATMTGAMTAMMKKCAEDEGVKKAFGAITGQ